MIVFPTILYVKALDPCPWKKLLSILLCGLMILLGAITTVLDAIALTK
jgi:hypothetical protein